MSMKKTASRFFLCLFVLDNADGHSFLRVINAVFVESLAAVLQDVKVEIPVLVGIYPDTYGIDVGIIIYG